MPGFTKQAIKQSFMKLLDERPLNKISVKDIVEDCGINRNSFYYHFQDIPALVAEIITEDAESIIAKYPSPDSIEQCLGATIEFALSHKKAMLHIYNSVSRDLYEQSLSRVCDSVVTAYFDGVCAGTKISGGDRGIFIRLYRGICFGLITEWLMRGMRDDITDDFDRICRLHSGMLGKMLERAESDAASGGETRQTV